MQQLMKRKDLGNYRELTIAESKIDFASNDYLGLARSGELRNHVYREIETVETHLNGFGSTGSRLLTGNTRYAMELEEAIAAFHGYESGLLFSCGYMANVGLLSTIPRGDSIILFDSHIHASMRDGMKLSQAERYPFRHNDPNHLEKRLKTVPGNKNCFICIESYYSTDGSVAPVEEISFLARKYGARLIVDEAHSVGICGPQGRGLVAEKNLCDHVFAQVVTFGKALGSHGAIVLGTSRLKETLINFSIPSIYTTAPPLHALASIKCSYRLLPEIDHLRNRLNALVRLFCSRQHTPVMTPIRPIHIAGNEKVKQAAESLSNKGFDIRALMSPTVRRGQECLRICLHAFNTEEEVLSLLEETEIWSGHDK